MSVETARMIGYAIGMALFGYIVLRLVNGPRKATEAEPRKVEPDAGGRNRRFATLAVVALLAGVFVYWLNRETRAPDFDEHCVAPLRTTEEFEAALSNGFVVDGSRRCISKRGYEEALARKELRKAP